MRVTCSNHRGAAGGKCRVVPRLRLGAHRVVYRGAVGVCNRSCALRCAPLLQLLEKLGAELVEVGLPSAEYGLATYYLIAPAECSSNLARFDGVRYGMRVEGADVGEMYEATRAAGFGPEVKRRILIGTYALSSGYYDAYYVKAQKIRTLIGDDFKKAFAACDLIACPAASSPAFAFNAKSDPYSMYMMDYYTIPMSLAGLPALSVPCGSVMAEGGSAPLPMGLQLCGPLFAERTLLSAAHAYERATNHAKNHKMAVPA